MQRNLLMIIKKNVKKFGTSGHVIIPPQYIGQDLYVVTDHSVLDLEELVTNTLLYRKAQAYEQTEMRDEMKEFKASIEVRLKRLEKIILD